MTIKVNPTPDPMPPDRAGQRSPLALTVLALLAEAPMHAYRMHDLIKRRGKDTVVNVTQRNSVYQTIARLLRAKLIAVQQTLQDEGRPERVVYEITDLGRAALTRWMREMLAVPVQEYPDFPAALAFLPVLTAKEVQQQLEARIGTIEADLAQLQVLGRDLLASGLPRLFLLEDEYKQAVMKAELAWLKRIVTELESKDLTWSQPWLRKVAAALEGPARSSDTPRR
jgi:DNA-binding PadR family transcriptional regulator